MLMITYSGSRQVTIHLSAHFPRVLDLPTNKCLYSAPIELKLLTNAVAQPSGTKLIFLLQNANLLKRAKGCSPSTIQVNTNICSYLSSFFFPQSMLARQEAILAC